MTTHINIEHFILMIMRSLAFFVLLTALEPHLVFANCGVYDNKIDINGDLYKVKELEIGDPIRGEVVVRPEFTRHFS